MTAWRGTPRVVTPPALAAESRARLAADADPLVAARSRSYFKEGETVAFYGLKSPALRQIERGLSNRVEPHWTLRDAVAYCDVMLAVPQLEAKGLGLMLLARHSRSFTPGLLRTAKSWLARGRCANWATTDGLSLLVIASILRRWPHHLPTMTGWTRSRSLWVRRAAAVALIPMARRGQALDVAYDVAARLLDDEEDLIHKATGWLLREAGKTDPARLEHFLLAQGPRLPRTALRYAIERFPPTRRRRLLSQTSRSVGLAAEGRMRPPGLVALRAGRPSGSSDESKPVELDVASQRKLRANERAWRFFAVQPPWYRRMSGRWVASAKRPETRARRLEALITCSARGTKVPPLARPAKVSGAGRRARR